MKKLLLFTFIVGFLTPVFSQDEETHEKRGVYDRILMDVYFENWLDTSYKLPGKWHSRGISGFYLYDIPFEKNSQFSSAIGLGASSHNVFLKDSIGSHPDSTSRYYTFLPIESNDNFKKYKFSTNYIDAALELRFRSKPDKFGNRIKFTLGARVGYLVNIHSKTVRNKRDRYKWFLFPDANKWRYGTYLRFGYQRWQLFGYYQFSTLFEKDKGDRLTPVSAGITYILLE